MLDGVYAETFDDEGIVEAGRQGVECGRGDDLLAGGLEGLLHLLLRIHGFGISSLRPVRDDDKNLNIKHVVKG